MPQRVLDPLVQHQSITFFLACVFRLHVYITLGYQRGTASLLFGFVSVSSHLAVVRRINIKSSWRHYINKFIVTLIRMYSTLGLELGVGLGAGTGRYQMSTLTH